MRLAFEQPKSVSEGEDAEKPIAERAPVQRLIQRFAMHCAARRFGDTGHLVEWKRTNRRDCSREVEAVPYANYRPEEVETRGEEIYEQQIRQKVEAVNKGKFVVIDIETGEYEVDDDDLQATKRVLAKRSDAVIYGLRVGYPTAYTMGGHVSMEQG